MVSVLFVCLGNICRSPAAEGLLRQITSQDSSLPPLRIESCGLGSWHVGQLPDMRMQDATRRRGVNLSSRAQQFQHEFFQEFDYILAADHEVLNVLYQYAKSPKHKAKVHLITEFSSSYKGEDIPDPFYENDAVFDLVLDMIVDSCEGLLEQMRKKQI